MNKAEKNELYISILHEQIIATPSKLWRKRAESVMIEARERMMKLERDGVELSETQRALLDKANRFLEGD